MPQVTQVELEGTTVECQDNKKSCEAKLLPATSDAQGIASVAPHVCHNSPPRLALFGLVRLHGMGWAPGAALRACSGRAPPIPSPTPVQK